MKRRFLQLGIYQAISWDLELCCRRVHTILRSRGLAAIVISDAKLYVERYHVSRTTLEYANYLSRSSDFLVSDVEINKRQDLNFGFTVAPTSVNLE